jgi:hypothetical protein
MIFSLVDLFRQNDGFAISHFNTFYCES